VATADRKKRSAEIGRPRSFRSTAHTSICHLDYRRLAILAANLSSQAELFTGWLEILVLVFFFVLNYCKLVMNYAFTYCFLCSITYTCNIKKNLKNRPYFFSKKLF
jgi:hypothetical protein